ncbi:hypothetical protein Gotur_011725 [Gossypium turneri]
MVIENGAVPIFVKLLGSPSHNVLQAVRALGNVAGGSPKCRELVLGHGSLLPLLAQLNEHAELSMLRIATWTLKSFCWGLIRFFVSQGYIKSLCDLLSFPDPRIVTVCFEGLEKILEAGETDENMDITGEVNLYAQMVEMQRVKRRLRIYRLMTTLRCVQRLQRRSYPNFDPPEQNQSPMHQQVNWMKCKEDMKILLIKARLVVELAREVEPDHLLQHRYLYHLGVWLDQPLPMCRDEDPSCTQYVEANRHQVFESPIK